MCRFGNVASQQRLLSIDIFRAVTMWLMIFVNDLWTLESYPHWLGHATFEEDFLGLSDVVYPAFLFIVGLSIPLAMKARKSKGDSTFAIVKHILFRSLALIVMGFFMVNLENINANLMQISKPAWMFLMALSFVLIWNRYKSKKVFNRVPSVVLQGLGLTLLAFLAFIYEGGTGSESKSMQPYWWGILGLIGWSYLLVALVFVVSKGRLALIAVLCTFLLALNISEQLTMPVLSDIKLVVGASNHLCVAFGVLVTLITQWYAGHKKEKQLSVVLGILGFGLIILGILTRPEWGISKLRATPSWTLICSGISTLCFLLLYWIADLQGKVKWAKFIGPAGRSTLTCYLVPYFYYSLLAITAFYLPEFLRSGYIGILKSVLFGLLVIQITGLLERVNIKLKI